MTTIAHELGTPLMTANGNVQLIQNGAIPKDTMDPIIETNAPDIQQITALDKDILFIQQMDKIIPKV